jgi:hypothetical protein
MVERKWKPGQSGNPSGGGGEYHRCRALCRERSAEAAAEIIRLYQESDHDRVRYMAAQWVYEQAWGKAPPSYDPSSDPERRPDTDFSQLTPEQRDHIRQSIAMIKAAQASPSPPKQAGVMPNGSIPVLTE